MTLLSSPRGWRSVAIEPESNAGGGGVGDEHSLAAALAAPKPPAGAAGAAAPATPATQPPSLFSLPASPGINPNFATTITLQNPFTVSAGTIFYTTSLELMYNKADYSPNGSPLMRGMVPFINNGTLWNRCLNDYVGTVISSQNFDYITNNGLIVSEAPTGQAMTIEVRGFFQGLTNNGGIFALSTKRGAFAVITWDSGPILNEGIIAAHRAPAVPDGPNDVVYGAYAIIRYNGGPIVNGAAGSILAEAPRATAIRLDRGTILAAGAQGQPDILNAGRIEAVATDAHYQSVGVEFTRLDLERMNILNSGTIRADIAILLGEYTPSGALQARQLITNLAGGVIDGAISMSRYDEIILNHGLIDGAVAMFEGDDFIINTARMIGPIDLGAGDDLYRGVAAAEAVTVNGNAGIDLLIGGSAADSLDGGEGNDWLQGGGGGDILVGGAGADRFVIADAGDSSAAAADTVRGFESGVDKIDLSATAPTSVALSTSGGVTTLTAQTAGGTIVIHVEGTVAPGDILQGPAGTVLNGTSAAEILNATGAVTELHGGDGKDLLVGSTGNDFLDGGAGPDIMIGGPGSDVYIVEDPIYVLDANFVLDTDTDRVIELDGEGVDEVRTYVQYALPDAVENLTFLGAGGIRVEGNTLDNVMTGNAENNILAGGGGNDVLIGGAGSDILDGGPGADRFVYLASGDSTAAAFDVLYGFESGIDKIDLSALSVASINWTQHTENDGISLTNYFMVTVATSNGPLTIRVTANALSMADFQSVIAGTSGNDVLHGTFFGDSIDGMGGNDTIYGGDGDDAITGGAGQNSLYGEGGNDRLTAAGGAGDWLFGGLGNDTMIGGAGNDRLQGDAGSDRLTGGAGADTFIFAALGDSPYIPPRSDGYKMQPDVVTDFISGTDKIDLTSIDADSQRGGDQAFTFIGTGAFTGHAGELRVEIAGPWLHIMADVDGNGQADFALVVNGPVLTASDFIL